MKHFLLALGLAAGAQAGTITVTEQATVNGSLDGTAFTGKLVTITFTGNTANIVSPIVGFSGIDGTGSVTVAGVGSDTFTSVIQAYSDNTIGEGGIETDDPGSNVEILRTDSPAFDSYGLNTSFGPITGVGGGVFGHAFNTVGGTFDITAITVVSDHQDSTFTATTATPEPGSSLLIGAGMAAIAALALSKR